MKFKTKEELLDGAKEEMLGTDIFEQGLDTAFESFAERINFYDKYRNRIQAFHDIYGGQLNEKDLNEISNCLEFECYEDFNKWLFNKCFGDIIK